jgi:hypothetical protein
MENLLRHELYLRLLIDAPQPVYTALIRSCPDSLLCVICAAAITLLLHKTPVSPEEIKLLKAQRRVVHNLANSSHSAGRKRRTITSKRGLPVTRLILRATLRALDNGHYY